MSFRPVEAPAHTCAQTHTRISCAQLRAIERLSSPVLTNSPLFSVCVLDSKFTLDTSVSGFLSGVETWSGVNVE